MTRFTALGIGLTASVAGHAAACAVRGHPGESLWACHVGAGLIGLGCLTRWPLPTVIGSQWVALGTPLWIVELLLGGDATPTSVLTHCLGFAAIVPAAARIPWPAGSWWKAVVALGVLQLLCRAVTDPADNVNAAFELFGRMQSLFPSYLAYEASAAIVASISFFATERCVVVWQRRNSVLERQPC